MNKYDKIPQELKDLDQWVCCFNNSKAPMSAYEIKPASSTNDKTWAFFEQAAWAVEHEFYDNIGFVFADNGYVGIDIDTGYENGELTPMCKDIIEHCKSYTEKSRSGRGVHIIVKGDIPYPGRNNMNGVEIYKSRRFFITTGYQQYYENIVENQEAIDYILSTYFSNEVRDSNFSTYKARIYNPKYMYKAGDKTIPLRPYYEPISEGGRNVSLTSLAGQMKSTGYSQSEIYHELQIANEQACIPQLPDRELRSICTSVFRYSR